MLRKVRKNHQLIITNNKHNDATHDSNEKHSEQWINDNGKNLSSAATMAPHDNLKPQTEN